MSQLSHLLKLSFLVVKDCRRLCLPSHNRLRCGGSGLGTIPAVAGDVEDAAVWIAKLVLGIGRGVTARPRMVLAAMRFDCLFHRIDVVYPDAEMVQSDEVFATLVASILFGLEVEQRDVYHPSKFCAARDKTTLQLIKNLFRCLSPRTLMGRCSAAPTGANYCVRMLCLAGN